MQIIYERTKRLSRVLESDIVVQKITLQVHEMLFLNVFFYWTEQFGKRIDGAYQGFDTDSNKPKDFAVKHYGGSVRHWRKICGHFAFLHVKTQLVLNSIIILLHSVGNGNC